MTLRNGSAMTDQAKNCPICLKPKTTSSSGFVTQFLGVCHCAEVAPSAQQSQSLKICKFCGKSLAIGRDGSLTQWIFRFDRCGCQKPEALESDIAHEVSEEDEIDIEPSLDLDPDSFPADRYQAKIKLGSGASGRVYLAFDKLLRKKVAVKILHELTPQQLIAFQDEAKTTSKLNHKGIIGILDFGPTRVGLPYMVLEYQDRAISLDDRIKKKGALDVDSAMQIFSQVVEALAYAHDQQVYHRDIKPSNILLCNTKSGDVSIKIIDFGVARIKPVNQELTTATGAAIVGTPAYMAPELANNESFDSRSEIYTIGCVLFEALTGRPPFSGDSALEILSMHANKEAPSLNDVTGAVFPIELEKTISRCLAKKKTDRFQSMREVLHSLQLVSDHDRESNIETSVLQDMPAAFQRRDNAIWLKVAAAAAVVIVGIIAFSLSRPSESEPKKIEKASEPAHPATLGSAATDNVDETSFAEIDEENQKLDEQILGRKMVIESKELSNANILGMRYKDVSEIEIINCKITDKKILRTLGDFPGLQVLKIQKTTGLTADNMKQFVDSATDFRPLGNGKDDLALDFSYSDIGDDGISNLSEINDLRLLSLKGTKITDSGMKKLVQFTGLRGLDISETQVTGKGLANLNKMQSLVLLKMNDCPHLGKDARNTLSKRITTIDGEFEPGKNSEIACLYQAASRGNAEAQFELGSAYHFGKRVKPDAQVALKWYMRAVEQGHVVAKNNLGALYMSGGNGVKQNGKEALKWYLEAANAGEPNAINNVGLLYTNGNGAPKDYVKAFSWYMKAATQGNAKAQNNIGFAYANALGVKQDYARAQTWFLKAAAAEDPDAYCNLGFMYEYGMGVPKNVKRAFHYYTLGAAQKHGNSMCNLGSMYDHGVGVERDPGAAAEWYHRGADEHSPEAANNLAKMYEDGRGIRQDYAQALTYYKQAAVLGLAISKYHLGYMYEHGLGVRKNFSAAYKWYHEGAEQGCPEAQRQLGRLFEEGEGITKDLKEAKKWYGLAAQKGDKFSEKRLAKLQ